MVSGQEHDAKPQEFHFTQMLSVNLCLHQLADKIIGRVLSAVMQDVSKIEG